MKKLVLLIIVLSTMSCTVMQYEPKFTIGMTALAFKQSNKSAMRVYGDDKGIEIYRTHNPLGFYKFFVFSKEKLVKFEEGTLADDFRYINY